MSTIDVTMMVIVFAVLACVGGLWYFLWREAKTNDEDGDDSCPPHEHHQP